MGNGPKVWVVPFIKELLSTVKVSELSEKVEINDEMKILYTVHEKELEKYYLYEVNPEFAPDHANLNSASWQLTSAESLGSKMDQITRLL